MKHCCRSAPHIAPCTAARPDAIFAVATRSRCAKTVLGNDAGVDGHRFKGEETRDRYNL